MPKRIPHLSETILDKASSLFSSQGYDAVDMKQVAVEAGTSVGNLYNYFPSKPALFLAIKARWKEDLFEACQGILESSLPRRERILAVLSRMYDDVSKWMEFLSGREEKQELLEHKVSKGFQWSLGEEELQVFASFDALLIGQPSTEPPYRWAFLVVTATAQMASRYPGHRDENWKFLENLVDKI